MQLLNTVQGNILSQTFNLSGDYAGKDNKIQITWTPNTAASNVSINIYGRMSTKDAWVLLLTVTQADLGSGTSTYSTIKNIVVMPLMYLEVTESTDTQGVVSATLYSSRVKGPAYNGNHVFDFDSKVPATMNILYSENWLGILTADTISGVVTPGTEPDYGLWEYTEAKAVGTGWNSTNPTAYPNDPYAIHFPAACGTTGYHIGTRSIGSRYNPLNGIYSSTGLDTESLNRLDLKLGLYRGSSNKGARFDVFMGRLNINTEQTQATDYPFLSWKAHMHRCDQLGYSNCIMPQYNAPGHWIYNLTDMTEQERREAAINDMTFIINTAKNRKATFRVDGRIVFSVFINGDNSQYLDQKDWKAMLDRVRKLTGEDFYAITGFKSTNYFEAFDGIFPWVDLTSWNAVSGATDRLRAEAWAALKHESFLDALPSYPGRVVLGQVIPGFDDWTKSHGDGIERITPVNADMIHGQFDSFTALRAAGKEIKGFLMGTWDDWGEGTIIEPTVELGTTIVKAITEDVGAWYSETVVAADTTAMEATFTGFGFIRACP